MTPLNYQSVNHNPVSRLLFSFIPLMSFFLSSAANNINTEKQRTVFHSFVFFSKLNPHNTTHIVTHNWTRIWCTKISHIAYHSLVFFVYHLTHTYIVEAEANYYKICWIYHHQQQLWQIMINFKQVGTGGKHQEAWGMRAGHPSHLPQPSPTQATTLVGKVRIWQTWSQGLPWILLLWFSMTHRIISFNNQILPLPVTPTCIWWA